MASGKVGEAKVVKVIGGDAPVSEKEKKRLSEKAVKATKQMKFTPAERDGHPVSQWVTLEYTFNSIDDAEPIKSQWT